MQNDPPSPPPITPAMPPEVNATEIQSSSGLRWLWIGGTGLLVLGLLCAGGFAWFAWQGKADIEPVVDAFQKQIDAENYAAAYQAVGPEWKAINTPAQFADFESTIFRQLGKMQSKSLHYFNRQASTNGGTAYIIYNCVYEKGQGQVKYSLTKSTGSWRIVGHHVESPAMMKVLACPSCNTVMNDFVQFCSACGAKMNR